MKKIIGCVLCNSRDKDLLLPFISAWESLDSGIELVLLVDQDSKPFNTHGLTSYPLLWEKNRRIALSPGVSASLHHAAVAEEADAIIKLDVDCIHRDLSWVTDNLTKDVVGFQHLCDPECFFGAAYYMTTKILGSVMEFLSDKPHWGRAEDIGISKSVRDLGADTLILPIDGVVCGTSDAVEYKPHLFDNYSVIHCGEFTKSRQGRARVAYMMKRLNLHSGVTKHKRAIVYPIKDGNANDCNVELVMSLRSIHDNLRDKEIPVFIMSEKIPPNISGAVNFVKVKSYEDAITQACDVADEILWMNDDIFLLRPHEWEDFRPWVKHGDPWGEETIVENETHGNNWRKRKGQVVRKLKEEGLTTFDYSSHTPYLYVTGLLKAVIREFNFGYKTAFETAYGNVARVSHREGFRKLQRYHDKQLPLDTSVYDILNYSDRGANAHVRGFLLGKFSCPSPYEAHDTSDLTTTLLSTVT